LASIWWSLLGLAVFLPHLGLLAFTKSLNSYSRRRLEDLCHARGSMAVVDEVAHYDERTARASEALFVVSGLLLAAILGDGFARAKFSRELEFSLAPILAVLGLGYLTAAVVGTVFAEAIIVHLWPVSWSLRWIGFPLTFGIRRLERLVARLADAEGASSRPASVEVEVPAESDEAEDMEAELPEKARELLEHAVALTRTEVGEIMTPRTEIVSLPATVSARDAALTFRETGLSRIPIYGVNRDDVLGILYAKDLFPTMTDPDRSAEIVPAELVRSPLFVPESKNAFVLLEEFRAQRTQLAVILDEYGGVAGLITLEDLLEELVGYIDDEHDVPTPDDPIRLLGEGRFELDAALPIELVNERLNLRLPTDEDFQTVGGLALHSLGRVPEIGDSFRVGAVAMTVAEVSDHAVRRLILDLKPAESGNGDGERR
jgi:CBS domain containing-hemolysin-like protein